MALELQNAVRASAIAEYLGTTLVGPDVEIRRIVPLGAQLGVSDLTFAHGSRAKREARLREVQPGAIILSEDLVGLQSCSAIVVGNPRLAFAQVLQQFFARRRAPAVSPSARIARGARVGARPFIGEFVVIGDDVHVGDDAVILDHVVILGPTRIGDRVTIKPHTVIGAEGFGVEFDENGTPVRIPQLGGVIVGSDVEFGSLTTVCSGTVEPTVVGDFVKCDDHVHIAHNCVVGARTIITAGAIISGSVSIGSDAWLGPNCCVMNGASLGDRSFVGLGAVVTKSVDVGAVVAGNPARFLKHR
jgi:UDP-3-O-[3-hydroxymyristoyl] glucosamine N-acyltransferase LpxD